jgi:predicted AlkP superfamily pyrophosphatase or phosphodiesterase
MARFQSKTLSFVAVLLLALITLPQCTTSDSPTKSALKLRQASRTASAVQMSTRQVRFDARDQLFPKQPAATGIKLVWISLDGLQHDMLQQFVARQERAQNGPRQAGRSARDSSLHKFGIKYLLAQKSAWKSLQVSDPTITASSHASTMTCASPGLHGVIANSQWNGEKTENGFDKIHQTETFVQALRSSGHTVWVSGYPGFDGRAPNRIADTSVSYDSPTGKSQIIALQNTDGSAQAQVNIAITPKAGAPDAPKYQLVFQPDANSDSGKLLLDNQVIGSVGTDSWTEIKIDDSNVSAGEPAVRAASQMASVRLFKTDSGAPAGKALSLYISATTTNRVNPAEFAQKLDERGLIFAAGKDYGTRAAFGDTAFLATMEQNLRYFTATSHEALSSTGTDAVFLYFEDLDVLGHQYAGDAKSTAVVDAHLRKFDQALGSIFARIRPETNVLIAGDHGMSAINFELNALELIPADIRSKFQVRASGGSLFVYGPDKASLTALPPANESYFQQLVSALEGATLPGETDKKIFSHVIVRGTQAAIDAGWRDGNTQLPWVFATVQPGVGIKSTTDQGLLLSLRQGATVSPELLARAIKTPDGKLPEPVPYGQHGHASETADMKTSVIAFGPALTPAFAGVSNTTNLLLSPRVADALGWQRPASCATTQLPQQ